MEAKKYDQNKTRMDLVPLSVMENLAKILTMGANKYGENNWQELPDFWKRYKAALLRHLTAIDKGELIDQESGLPHIDHVLCNAAFLSWGHHHGKAISINEKDIDTPMEQALAKLTGAKSESWKYKDEESRKKALAQMVDDINEELNGYDECEINTK